MNGITEESWRRLYELSRTFRKEQPWLWMYNTDLFGVEDPETGNVGYCSVMGMDGLYLGLAVYRGLEGLSAFEQALEMGSDADVPGHVMRHQNCMMFSLGSKSELSEADLAQIKALGLKFRGETHWPLFRDFQPGLVPWPLETESQVRFMILCIEKALEMARRFQQDPFTLDQDKDPNLMLLLRPSKRLEGGLDWSESWEKPAQKETPGQHVRVNKLYVRSNLANFPRKDEEWIADVFYIPTPVAQPDSDRPFVPYMLVIASQDTGLILGHQVFDPRKIELTFAEEFVKIIKSKGYLPSQLWIARHESRLWFEEIAENIQLPLDADPDSPVIEEIKLGLFGSFSV